MRLNTPVTAVAKRKDGWLVNDEEFDVVVNTISLTLVPDFVHGIPTAVADAMRTLEYNSLVSFLDRPEHPDLSWIYLPQRA